MLVNCSQLRDEHVQPDRPPPLHLQHCQPPREQRQQQQQPQQHQRQRQQSEPQLQHGEQRQCRPVLGQPGVHGGCVVCTLHLLYRRRTYTEEKAKAVADVWGTVLIKFLVALASLHHDDAMMQNS